MINIFLIPMRSSFTSNSTNKFGGMHVEVPKFFLRFGELLFLIRNDVFSVGITVESSLQRHAASKIHVNVKTCRKTTVVSVLL